jgi:hypothetical protein
MAVDAEGRGYVADSSSTQVVVLEGMVPSTKYTHPPSLSRVSTLLAIGTEIHVPIKS